MPDKYKLKFNFAKAFGQNRGFTLIELIVYIVLIGIIMAVVSETFMVVIKLNSRIVAAAEVNANASAAMERIIYEIQNAKYVYTPTSNFLTATPELSLATAQNASAVEGISYIDFYLQNNTIFLKTEGVSPVALTSPNVVVENMQFSYFKNGNTESVKIDFTIKPKSGLNSNLNIHLVSIAALRN